MKEEEKMGKHSYQKAKRDKIKRGILFILVVIFIISGIKLITYGIHSKEDQMIIEQISQSITDTNKEEKYTIDFETLKQINSDTIGYLKVNGTEIETVVVQAEDNEYYVSHNFEKNRNSAGWVFVDYRNQLDSSDKNRILYGHNMKNNTMFGTLKNVLKEDWKELEENRYITFITEKEYAIYEVFSVYEIQKEDYYIKTDFESGEFADFLINLKQRSKYYFDVEINENDSILTLSTCANNNKYRVVLHAKKTIQ